MNYRAYRNAWPRGKFNGAYYYAKELEKYFVPTIKTDRPWDLLGMRLTGHFNRSIVFIHHNLNWDKVYPWVHRYKDLVLVCSTKPTYEWAKSTGHRAIFLPLSIDVDYVKKFSTEKTKGACYSGNRWKFKREDEDKNIPEGVDFPPTDLKREELLKFIAPYRELYAIGRCALEGIVLGCKIRPFYNKYPDPSYWKVLDSKDAAKMLQHELDTIDSMY